MKQPPQAVLEWLRRHNLLNTPWTLEECAHGGTAKLMGSINWGEPYVGTNASLEFTVGQDDSLRLALRYQRPGQSIDYEWANAPNLTLVSAITSLIRNGWAKDWPANDDLPGQMLLEVAS